MDTLIKSILQIESDAQKLVAEEKARQTHFEQDCADKRAQMEQEIGGRCERRMAQMREAEEAYRAGEIGKIRSEAEGRLRVLEAHYEESKGEWVRRLVGNIVGGE